MNDEIYIFGSVVRGEVSPSSDVDVLVIPGELPSACYPDAWSVYTKETLEMYFKMGRLFAWHLHLEARRIYPKEGPTFLSKLGEPSPYLTADSDIDELADLLKEAVDEIRRGTNSLIYEIGVAYTAVRNIGMAASWRLLQRPSFSQYVPYALPVSCPLPVEAYRGAMLARHRSTRGSERTFDAEAVATALVETCFDEWLAYLRNGRGEHLPK